MVTDIQFEIITKSKQILENELAKMNAMKLKGNY